MIIEKPGIYPDLSNDNYHKSPGISASGISLILDCPRKYWWNYLSGEAERKDTPNMKLGRLVHTLVLEPETFTDLYYRARPDQLKREIEAKYPNLTKKEIDGMWAQEKLERELYVAQHADKELIDDDLLKQATAMADSIKSQPLFQKMMSKGDHHIEHSLMWEDDETGALFRSRPDYYNAFCIIDIKTTKDASPEAFSRSVYQYGYHRQGAMAIDGLNKLAGGGHPNWDSVVTFVVESDAPYISAPYLLSENAIQRGREEYKKGGLIYKDCLANATWNGYSEQIVELDLPQWAYNKEV